MTLTSEAKEVLDTILFSLLIRRRDEMAVLSLLGLLAPDEQRSLQEIECNILSIAEQYADDLTDEQRGDIKGIRLCYNERMKMQKGRRIDITIIGKAGHQIEAVDPNPTDSE